MSIVIRPDFSKQRSDNDLLKSLRVSPEVLAHVPAPRERESAPKRQKRVEGRFIIAPLEGLIAAAAALDARPMLLWLFLVYESRLRNGNSVKVTNQALARWGIDRRAKYHALKRLEAVGLISVERRGKSSPVVTIRGVS